jgi:glycyl-tRNA synthetase
MRAPRLSKPAAGGSRGAGFTVAKGGAAARAKDTLRELEGSQRFEAVVDLAARRGFFHPSATIYGGLAGFFDYGPLGAPMRRKMEGAWVDYWLKREGFYLIDTPTVGPEAVFRASGHLEKFSDPLVECKACGTVSRADSLDGGKCPNCGARDFTPPRQVNLMLETKVGATKPVTAYLRPETAQGIFWNFPVLLRNHRGRLPFGVAQLGLGYRNEIAPRNALFRLREFHMAEVEVFIDPDQKTWPRFEALQGLEATFLARDGAVHLGTFGEMVKQGVMRSQAVGHFTAAAFEIVRAFGMPEEKIRLRQHTPEEMAHYAEDTWDLEFETSLGWIEVAGIADRGCYDLTRHQTYSGQDMSVFVPFDEPKMVEVDGFVPDYRALGPKYKAEAGAVGDAIKAAAPSQLQADGSLRVSLGGREITVDPAQFKREKRTEKKSGTSLIPHVIEPSFGLDRIFFALLDAAFSRVHHGRRPALDGQRRARHGRPGDPPRLRQSGPRCDLRRLGLHRQALCPLRRDWGSLCRHRRL